MPLRHLFLLLTTLVWGCASVATAQTYRDTSCPRLLILGEREGETVSCGFLTVAETRSREASKTLELAVMILHSRSATPAPDPLVFLQGGPGGAALSTAELWRDSAWRDTRDIILFDQRGTGYSRPNLKCPELYQDLYAGLDSCRARLARTGVDLRAYNSRENAADVEALRQALGIDSWNLYGVSYGTRLALTVLRDHPEGVRSVVLDSTYPPQVKRFTEFGANFERALNQVFTTCAADAKCSAAFPDLKRKFSTRISVANGVPFELFDGFDITGDDLLSIYFQGMYNEAVLPNLPYSMSKVADREVGDALLLLSGVVSGEEVDAGRAGGLAIYRVVLEALKWFWREVQSEGVFFSTECQEDVSFERLSEVTEASSGLSAILQHLVETTGRDMFDNCRTWRVGRGDAVENEPVVSDVPTLVLAGSFDPITPPSWGKLAAETLANSFFFEFPNAAHGVFLSGDCPVDMVQDFLDTPANEPDASCIADIRLEFYIPKSEE